MKLLRYGAPGAEKPGLVDQGGTIRSLNQFCDDLDLRTDPNLISRLQELQTALLPEVSKPGRIAPPIVAAGKFVGIGLNYRDHALEAKLPIPSEPVIFSKAISCVSGACDDIVLPPGSVKTDWEVELGIVIGRRAYHILESRARNYIAGYLVVNDISEREYQNERGGTWDKGKGCDTFGPIGPWLVTPDEVSDPQKLELWLEVNGQPMQRGNTSNMIFSCAEIVSYVSRFMTLLPGDIITTGTPPGVGLGRSPPIYLKAGDRVRTGISGLGEQHQLVVQSSRPVDLAVYAHNP